MEDRLLVKAKKHVHDIVTIALAHDETKRALVVYNSGFPLTDILTSAYKSALPHAHFLHFDTSTKEDVMEAINALSPGDLIVLIQTANFLLDAFRIRLHLFQKKLKVIEHTHLYRNKEENWEVYIDALAYDPLWYRVIGPKLKAKLDVAKTLCFSSKETTLTVTGGVEDAKLNIGDYTGMENIGGTFPIGEVFTESRDFTQMNGSVLIDAFAGGDFCISLYKPFRVDIAKGQVVSWGDAPAAFVDIMNMIREYERPLIREIGFGLNRAITRSHYVNDITAFERILGLHLSLGEKHSVYKKPGITTHKTKFHVDIFPVIDEMLIDGNRIFVDGAYII
jgi:hypothetical protein